MLFLFHSSTKLISVDSNSSNVKEHLVNQGHPAKRARQDVDESSELDDENHNNKATDCGRLSPSPSPSPSHSPIPSFSQSTSAPTRATPMSVLDAALEKYF